MTDTPIDTYDWWLIILRDVETSKGWIVGGPLANMA